MSELAGLLVETADRIFAGAATAPDGALDLNLWARIEEAQLDRLLLPEAAGGAGDAFVEAALVARRFGAHGCAVPFVESLVANSCIWRAQSFYRPGPKTIDAGIGTALPWPIEAVLCVTLDGQVRAPNTSSIMTDLGADPIGRYALEPDEGGEQSGLALYATLSAAAIAGALEAMLEMSLTYAKERRQFGRPIGAFQAVQHMIAQLAEETAAAVAAVQMAARGLSGAGALVGAAIAKIRASDAATLASRLAHQVHGAIGFTAEYPLARVTNRALAWRDRAGSELYWSERLGRQAIADPEDLWSFLLKRTIS